LRVLPTSADIDPGVGTERNLTSHPRQFPQERAAGLVADPLGDLLDGPAMQLAAVDQDLDYVAGHRAQDIVVPMTSPAATMAVVGPGPAVT